MTDKQSPLYELHAAAGASFTDFAGWQMPVSYGSDLAEHHAVRTAAGIFDISHMAEITVAGADAAAFLDHALAGRLSTVPLLKAKYSLLLAEDGGIIDDLIVYHTGASEFLVVANAGNHDPVVAALAERTGDFDVEVTDISDQLALIAVQGPNSRAIVEEALDIDLEALGYYASLEGRFADQSILVARTGYTGEDGFELYVDATDAVALWNTLLAAGAPHGLIPAGLASRDTLRLEAGMPLYGHELGLDTLPAAAGLGRVPVMTKEFVGRAGLEVAGTPRRVLVGLVTEGKRAGRAGYGVYVATPEGVAAEAGPVGVITSGALSPTLGYPIAMAYVDADALELPLAIDVRGTRIPASVVSLPFYKRDK
ncbi:glycine cleavage system aminomethyltransferase GcvT [soil metagenome]